MVEAMLDLVKAETERIDSRVLEPACGSGNFLGPVLRRKLAAVELKFGKSDFEKRHYAQRWAASSPSTRSMEVLSTITTMQDRTRLAPTIWTDGLFTAPWAEVPGRLPEEFVEAGRGLLAVGGHRPLEVEADPPQDSVLRARGERRLGHSRTVDVSTAASGLRGRQALDRVKPTMSTLDLAAATPPPGTLRTHVGRATYRSTIGRRANGTLRRSERRDACERLSPNTSLAPNDLEQQ